MVQAFVIDPSVLIQAYIQDSQTLNALALLKGLTTDPVAVTLHTPEFCLLECTNILWKQVGFNGAAITSVNRALARLQQTPLVVHPARTLLSQALSIGLEHELAVYDAIYIALAQSFTLPLITVDARQTAAAQKVGVLLKPITEFLP